MQRLLALRPRVTAVFAANDPTAIGAMKATWEAGLRVPEDIAVVGAGDIAHGDVLRVPLSTVSWSRQEMGTRAAELILGQVEGRPTRSFQRVIIPPRLVVRASCGAAARNSELRINS
jgi:LacI family transcriptional regulator